MDRDAVRRAFRHPREFTSSPLYRALSRTVAGDDRLLDLASQGRAGQYPTFLFFGAVHLLLLAGAEHPLARFFPSVVGPDAAPPDDAGPALRSFCAANEAELTEVITTYLVQTNDVRRSLGLRIGLSTIAPDIRSPVHLIEVGASAGLNLRFDRYGYGVDGRRFGDPTSPVQIVADRHGATPVPDLDAFPGIATTLGVDLNPIDVVDVAARAWLEALVWPENERQRALLTAALDLAAADPPEIRAGDAIDVLPHIAARIPDGEPRVVFHSATRLHVPADRLHAFDDAIASCGRTGPMWRLSIESASDVRATTAGSGGPLRVDTPDGDSRVIAIVDGHLEWVEMTRA